MHDHEFPHESFLVEEEGERIDKYLARRYCQSRTYFQSLIEERHVIVNDQFVKKRYLTREGDKIEVVFALNSEISLDPEDIPLNILYEDSDLLVINKPAGLVVHPAPGNWQGTLVNALLYHCKELENPDSLRPGIVHRLDKETSGVMVVAKNTKVHQHLSEQFSERKVLKEYLGICLGNPGNREISYPIARHPLRRKEMAVLENGKQALTLCETLGISGSLSLVRFYLKTGRTHQIRVHMKAIGTPLLGDSIYGKPQKNEQYGASRQMLHAHRLAFYHSRLQKMLDFTAEIPDDLRVLIEKIGIII